MLGKSTFISNFLQQLPSLCEPCPEKVIYCYQAYQPNFQILQEIVPNITFIQGLPPKEVEFWEENRNSLLILDDLAHQLFNDPFIGNLVTVKSHHFNVSVVILCQTLFPKGNQARLISLNTCYIVYFKNPRDCQGISVLGSQISPGNGKRIVEAYKHATQTPYSYLLIDNKQETPDSLRLRSKVLLHEHPTIIYND